MSQQDRHLTNDGTDRAEAGAPPANPILMVHNLLRGRYLFAIPLAILVAAPCAFFGYQLVPPKYESTGLLRVRANIQQLVYETPEAQAMPMFEAFLGTIANRLEQSRVLVEACDQPTMRDAGWTVEDVRQSISVGVGRQTELVSITVQDETPSRAQLAVKNVLNAYMEIYGPDGEIGTYSTRKELEDLRLAANARLQTYQRDIASLEGQFGTEQGYSAKVYELIGMEQEVNRMKMGLELAETQQQKDGAGTDPGDATGLSEPTLDELGRLDPRLASLLDERRGIELEIDSMKAEFGEAHEVMVELRRRLKIATTRIDEQVQVVTANVGDASFSLPLDPNSPIMSAQRLRERLAVVEPRWDTLREEVASLGALRAGIQGRRAEAAAVVEELDDINERIRQLRVEEGTLASGRVSIESLGDIPFAPSKDRRIPLAAGLAGIGAGSILAIFALVGLLKRSYRYVDELGADHMGVPLLGTVPVLSAAPGEAHDIARLSLHHLRNLLQQQTPTDSGGAVIALTSPASGDGKTSLSLALGMSYAIAGFRTVMVDADLVGRGLTSQLRMKDRPGLSDAVRARGLTNEISPTNVTNLEALPIGSDRVEPEQLSQAVIADIIAELREHADVVLIDTGPVLGSLEASLIAPIADAVVLVISRGRRTEMVRAAIKRVELLAGRCIGMVFNRADHEDLERSSSVVSISRASVRSMPRDEEVSQHTSSGPDIIGAILGNGIEVEERVTS